MPKVSIIVPVYNVEKYIEQCIQSLRTQSLRDIEIILVDDGSSDNCPMLCDKYTRIDKRIKVIHKQNGGLGLACNSGIEVASGEYIAFCDSDDYVDTIMYETLYNTALNNKCDVVYSGLKSVSMEGDFLCFLPHKKSFELYTGKENIEELLKSMIASPPPMKEERTIQVSAKTVLYSRILIEKKQLRFVSERLIPSEDLMFNINILAHAHRVCVIPQSFYNYRINQSSISRSIKLNKFPLFKNLYQSMMEQCHQLDITGDIDLRIKRLIIGYTRSYICQIILSNVTYNEKKNVIYRICKDNIWQNIYTNYPINKMHWTHRLFIAAMKMNSYSLLYTLTKIRK